MMKTAASLAVFLGRNWWKGHLLCFQVCASTQLCYKINNHEDDTTGKYYLAECPRAVCQLFFLRTPLGANDIFAECPPCSAWILCEKCAA